MKRLLQLHERTRRRVGLSAFVLLGLLPTLVILVWGVSRRLPSEETVMEERLSELFGLKVTVDAVEHPEPNRIRLRGLVFHRPELKDDNEADASATDDRALPVARLETLEIQRRPLPDPYEKPRETICLTGTDLEVNLDEIAEVTRLFREVVDYRLDDSRANVQLTLNRVRFSDVSQDSPSVSTNLKPSDHELSTIRFKLLALEDGPRAILTFCLVDSQYDRTSEPIRFRVGQTQKDNSNDRQNTSLWFDLYTQTEPIPCCLLGKCLPLFDSFGPDARFSGYFWAWSAEDGWFGGTKTDQIPDVKAKLSNVDLDTMVGRRFSQALTGKADITIDDASFHANRIESLYGRIESTEPGTIGRPLLTAAVNKMGMQVQSLYTDDKTIPFAELKASFSVDQRGILIEGSDPGKPGERLILFGMDTAATRRGLLRESGRWVDIAALLHTLAPGATAHIPAVRSVERLAQRLPTK